MEKDKKLKHEGQKQNYEVMEPSKKRMLLEKKRPARITANKLEISQKKGTKQYQTMDSEKS